MHYQLPAKLLQVVNRPGAWLLDTVYTMQLILFGELPEKRLPRLQYDVISNRLLRSLADRIFPSEPEGGLIRSANNVGNSVESHVWLLLELDRCDMILALAWHARRLERGW